MIEVKDGLRKRILKILIEHYPTTTKDLEDRLRIRKTLLNNELNKMQKEDIISFDVLPDKAFVRLLREDFMFTGIKKQDKQLKTKIRKKQVTKNYKNKNYDVMYI